MKRAAIYVRVSTAMQKMEGWSLDAQRDGLAKMAADRGWKVVGVYADEGKTARKRLKDRKEIFRLLEDVKAGKIDVILFKELDRWFRNVSDFYKVQDVLDQYGVYWVSERQPTLDMTTKEGRLAVNVLLSVAQNEADATSERIRYTNRFLTQQRRWNAGKQTCPRGYTVDENQHVVIDKEEEPFMRFLIQTVEERCSIRAGLLEAATQFNRKLNYSAMVRLFHNPLLYGEYKGDPGFIAEPYMTKEQFDKIQRSLRQPIKQNKKTDFIFPGLLQCGCCGQKLSGCAARERHYKSYRCHVGDLYHSHRYTCISEKKIEAMLLPYIREAIAGRIAEVKEVKAKQARKPKKSNRAEIDRKLDRLEDLYINSDTMSKDTYMKKREAILAKLIEDEQEPELPDVASLEEIQAIFNSDFDDVYRGWTDLDKLTFWRQVLRSVTIQDHKIIAVDFVE